MASTPAGASWPPAVRGAPRWSFGGTLLPPNPYGCLEPESDASVETLRNGIAQNDQRPGLARRLRQHLRRARPVVRGPAGDGLRADRAERGGQDHDDALHPGADRADLR